MPNYPALPDRRFAWDRDGSVGFDYQNEPGPLYQVVNTLTLTQIQKLNDEYSDTVRHANSTNYMMGVIFPELRDLTGYFLQTNNPFYFDWSTNTTNGVDGTWTHIATPVTAATQVGYRAAIQSLSLSGAKGIRVGNAGGDYDAQTFHLFGSITSGQSPDRLRLWHPTLNQELDGDYFNWNDIPRSSSGTKTFRVKNNSSTLTANTITLTIEALTDSTPSIVSAHSLDISSIGSLAPAATSAVITLTRTTPSNAQLSIWAARLVAVAATWT